MKPVTKLQIRLGHRWDFEALPAGSIALDGAVAGPRLDPSSGRYSFDHHEGCLRLITTATCRQVLDALLLGLDPSGFTAYLNDLDADTVLASWLLEHWERWKRPAERAKVGPLVSAVAGLDAHGPAYPLEAYELATEFHLRVMAPVREAARAEYPAGPHEALALAWAELESWWQAGLMPSNVKPPTKLELPPLRHWGPWVFASWGNIGGRPTFGASGALYGLGYDQLILHRQSELGHHYTLARRSDLVPGPSLGQLYPAFNAQEAASRGRPLAPGETWGGGSSVGGGPRRGSVLEPEQVAELLETPSGRLRPGE